MSRNFISKYDNMKIGLFIPCYINQFYPSVAIATLQLLERLDLDVDYPLDQTCCGQPLANAGYEESTLEIAQSFIENFNTYDFVVTPSGSCAHFVRKQYDMLHQTDQVKHVQSKTFELCEFLVKVIRKTEFDAVFPFRVGLHQSCHGLRGLRLAKSSERVEKDYSLVKDLLEHVKGLELVDLDREDECCGFGGTFAVTEEAISVKMAKDRLDDHLRHKAEVITATDMSCLMHLEGVAKRNRLPIKTMHIAEILNHRS